MTYCVKVVVPEGVKVEPYKKPPAGTLVAKPSPNCIISPVTEVVEFKRIEVIEATSRDGKRKYYVLKRGKEVYVYPSEVFERVKFYIDHFQKFGYFPNPGLLFVGPPGTGKTTLANLFPQMLGLEIVEFRAENVLGMFVGESEKKAKELLEKAKNLSPSAVLADEADSFLISRDQMLRHVGSSTADLNVKSILLDFMSKNVNSDVLVIAVTNLSPSLVDPALKREGRFGVPIYVPPPDRDAVRIFIEHAYPEFEVVKEELSTKLASMGLSFANIVSFLKRVKIKLALGQIESVANVLEEPIEAEATKGYRTFYTTRTYENKTFDKYLRFAMNSNELITVKYTPWGPDIVIALLVAYFAKLGVSNVVIFNKANLEEAIKVAEARKAVIIVDPRGGVKPEDVYKVSTSPVIYLSDSGLELVQSIGAVEQQVVFDVYNIKYEVGRTALNERDFRNAVTFCKGAGKECVANVS
jgi:hypothetical protein